MSILSGIPQSTSRRCAALATVVLSAALAGHASAEDYLALIGGPGGGQFQALCPSGQLLIGLDLRAADDVDAMRPVCATAYWPNVVGDVSQGNWYGGSGGRFHAAICPGDRPIVYGMSIGAEGVDTVIVNDISLDCGLAAETQPAKRDPNRTDAGFDGPSYMPSEMRIWMGYGFEGARATGSRGDQQCPIGQVAVGVHGRSGIWLDAIGLICGQPQVIHAHVPPPPKKSLAEQRTTTSIAQSSKTAAASVGGSQSTTQASRSAGYGIVSAAQDATPVAPAPDASTPPPHRWTICDAARAARARNSPAAPNLEAQCLASGGKP